jgi:hypothetical protein
VVPAVGPQALVFLTEAGGIGSNLAFITSPGSIHANITGGAAGPPVIGTLGATQAAFVSTSRDGLVHVNRISDGFPVMQGFPVATGAAIAEPPALADIDGDGMRDIVVFAGNRIHVYNHAGALLDNYPKTVSSTITSHPVIADVDGDGDVDIVAVTEHGLVVAFDKSGTMARGFPLQAGTGAQSVAVFAIPSPQLSVTDIGLAVAASFDGSVNAWKTGSVSGNIGVKMPWPQYLRDAQHTGASFEPLSGTPLSSEFFPAGRAYNWPNPVYDGRTFIRYFVKDNASVNIKVFDLAGDLVTTIANAPGVGGVDNEVEWKVTDVQSGVYFARIEANSPAGNGVAVVKIAVVK